MQSKTIKSVLRRKVEAWAKTVTDPEVAKIIQENTIITGGAIVSMLMQEPVNDYDVYFRTGEAAFAVAKYYVDKFVTEKKNNVALFLCDESGKSLESTLRFSWN
jgi:hypothetical protein